MVTAWNPSSILHTTHACIWIESVPSWQRQDSQKQMKTVGLALCDFTVTWMIIWTAKQSPNTCSKVESLSEALIWNATKMLLLCYVTSIMLTPYMVLPLFATRFAAYAGGILVSFIQPCLLIWYKMFCMRDISYRLIWMKCINMHSVYAQSGTQAFWLMNYCGFYIEPFCSDVCGDHQRPQTLAEIYKNMGICCGFRVFAQCL